MKLFKISAIAMTLALSAFSGNAVNHAEGFECSRCTKKTCGDSATEDFLRKCGDCPGLEVADCGVRAFDSSNCQGAKSAKDFNKRCQSAAKMMSKALFQVSLKAKENNRTAKRIMQGFRQLDEADMEEAHDRGADKYGKDAPEAMHETDSSGSGSEAAPRAERSAD